VASALGPRSRRVYEAMRERIVGGEWRPGLKLASHAELSNAFGVAPMTLRQALTALADDGLISLEHGRGTFVRPVTQTTVLIVEDETPVRLVLREHVAAEGYNVIEAANPEEGLEALEADQSIRLVLSDVRMPTTEVGVEFIRTVRRRWPELPLAAVTAFPEDLADLHGTPECPILIISKPFRKAHIERVLQLAVRRPAAAAAPPSQRVTREPRQPVLVVDDDPDIRELLRENIQELGYEVHEAASGGQALVALNNRRFGHVFLDVRMPGGSVELASAIAEAHPSTAVVIVTGYPEDILRLSGAFTILKKPFDREGVRSSLELRRAPVSASP
jgi:CheY-like chemotaxis protein